jgi:hypothetical protein
MRWVGHVARMGEERGVYRVLVKKPEVKRPFGRSRRRWEDNVNSLPSNGVYIYIYIYMSYRTANLQMLHFKYLFNKCPY